MIRSSSLILSALLFTVCFAPSTVSAENASPAECATRFHAALKGEPRRAFDAIKALRAIAREGDERLPGKLVMSPPRVRRDGDEMRALRASVDLAKAQGRPSWTASADGRWIVDRTIADLTDFIDQGPAPFLCGGVENFVSVLGAYLDRVSAGGGRSLGELADAQAVRTRRSIAEAGAVMRPVPKPRYAPDLRPIALVGPVEGLNPAIELRRGYDSMGAGRAMMMAVSQVGPSVSYGPRIDPGLPMKVETQIPLASEAERLAAIDTLLSRASDAGYLPKAAAVPARTDPAVAGAFRPVLTRLATLAPTLEGPGSPVADQLVRRHLLAALSDLEILDYLSAAERGDADPLLAAISGTFNAILDARRKAMQR
ncbi:hypothetical protein U0C82_00980 [Fulvimarina sp. 2208YS6-2-32]|uniref:Uncharacterized protein n=1 Tax=Fulvimarina uroteuthidis TaxID=3098149 RepID=A0ABU5I0M0_9HYPH|nr:hypothetical protein [Fulvimarina sp. 2208YS6-2-32]MDY8107721.1 hypothetical protein [Fulvimarina sp. 2208YS6-2-32]